MVGNNLQSYVTKTLLMSHITRAVSKQLEVLIHKTIVHLMVWDASQRKN